MIHVFFKENGVYKMRVFLNAKALFSDPIKYMEEVIVKYEAENGELIGDLDEKAVKIPVKYLEENNYTVFEKDLTKDEVNDIKKYQNIIEL